MVYYNTHIKMNQLFLERKFSFRHPVKDGGKWFIKFKRFTLFGVQTLLRIVQIHYLS